MKKTGILAGACALAVGLSAFADTWFDAKISTYTSAADWPNTSGIVGGVWEAQSSSYAITDTATLDTTGGAGASKLVVDTDDDAPLTFHANTQTTSTTPAISATVKFNTFDESAVSSLGTDARAGLIVVKKATDPVTYAFYGLVSNDTSNAWAELSGVTPDATSLESTFAVTISFNSDGDTVLVTYKIGETALTYNSLSEIPVCGSGSFSYASFSGCGEVSSLAATYTVPTGELEVDMSGSDSLAFTVATNTTTGTQVEFSGTTAQVPVGNTVRIYFAPKEGYVISGNAYIDRTMVSEGIMVNDSTEDLPTATAGEAKIGSTYYLTLNAAIEAAGTDDIVELVDDISDGDSLSIAKNVVISLGGCTYALATDNRISLTAGSAVITNGTITGTVFMNGGSLTDLTDLTIDDATFLYGASFADNHIGSSIFAARIEYADAETTGTNGQLYATFQAANGAVAATDAVYLRANLTLGSSDQIEFAGEELVVNSYTITLADVAATLKYGDGGALKDNEVITTTVAEKEVAFDEDTYTYYVTDPAPSTVTLSVTFGSNITSVKIGDGEAQTTSPAQATLDPGTNVALTVAAADWYTVSFTQGSANQCTTGVGGLTLTIDSDATAPSIGLTATKVEATDITNDTREVSVIAAEIGVTNASFTDDKAALSKVVSWASGTGSKTIAQINALDFTAPGQTEKAYLFNVGDSAEAVATAQAGFVLTGITPGEIPSATDKGYNGVIRYEGTDTLSPPAWTTATSSHLFYRATLNVK